MHYLYLVMRWLWVPLLLSLVMVIVSIPRYRLQKFFASIGFRGCDGKLPKRKKHITVNSYLKKITFRSRIPLAEWERVKADIELFYKRKAYAIKQRRKDLRMTDIFLIEQELPSFIEWRDDFMEEGPKFAIGEGYGGKVIWDAGSLPHGLIAGSSGSGKTAILRSIIFQSIRKKYNVQVFDFKGGGDYTSLEKYHDLEMGYGSFIISDPEETRQLLLALTIEVKERLTAFKEAGVSNIDEHNARCRERFVPWMLVIDEAAELLDVKPKDRAEKDMYAEIDNYLRSLARMSRAAGVHILMGFIRPDATVLDGQIKNTLTWRVAGYFADPAASRIVLDSDRATELPPEIKGRFIVGDEEVQAYYLPIPKADNEDGG